MALEVEKIGKSDDLSAAPAAVTALDGQLKSLIGELLAFLRERT